MKSNVIRVDFGRSKAEPKTEKSVDALYIRNKMLDISGWWLRLTVFIVMAFLGYIIVG